MDADHDHERRFHGGPERLRSPERLAMMEPARVAALSVEGLAVREMLDIGTGTGVFAEAFAERGISATGVDVNEGLLALARELVPAGRFVEAPAENLPFPAGSFDLLVVPEIVQYGLARMYVTYLNLNSMQEPDLKTDVFRSLEEAVKWVEARR